MSRIELLSRQYSFLEGRVLVCNEWLGPDLARTWQVLRAGFESCGSESVVARHCGRAAACLFYGFDSDWGIERMVIAGLTRAGYVAKPVLILENESLGSPRYSAHTLKFHQAFGYHDFWEPWRPVIDRCTEIIDREVLLDLEYMAEGCGYPSLYLQRELIQSADWRRRTELFSRWDLQHCFDIEAL